MTRNMRAHGHIVHLERAMRIRLHPMVAQLTRERQNLYTLHYRATRKVDCSPHYIAALRGLLEWTRVVLAEVKWGLRYEVSTLYTVRELINDERYIAELVRLYTRIKLTTTAGRTRKLLFSLCEERQFVIDNGITESQIRAQISTMLDEQKRQFVRERERISAERKYAAIARQRMEALIPRGDKREPFERRFGPEYQHWEDFLTQKERANLWWKRYQQFRNCYGYQPKNGPRVKQDRI